jgi:hypothetical protein
LVFDTKLRTRNPELKTCFASLRLCGKKITKTNGREDQEVQYNNLDLRKRKIYQKVAWLKELPANEAERVFRECSRSRVWARRMTVQRPYRMLESLFGHAKDAWAAAPVTDTEDWAHIEARLSRLLER